MQYYRYLVQGTLRPLYLVPVSCLAVEEIYYRYTYMR